MGLLDKLFLRLGYVKIERYGLTLAPNGHIVPMTQMVAAPAATWRAPTGDGMPLPAPEVTKESFPMPRMFATPPPPPIAAIQPMNPQQRMLSPYPAAIAPAASAAMPAAAAPAQANETEAEPEEGSGEWEWKLAMARAKAREDITQVIPQHGQMQAMQRPQPAPAPRQRAARGSQPPRAPIATPPRPPVGRFARPPGLPGVAPRPSDRPLGAPAAAPVRRRRSLGDDTKVDARPAPANRGGDLPRFTSRFAR
jgi:hypothetical protein